MGLSLGSEVVSLLDSEAFDLERRFAQTFQVWRHEKFVDQDLSFRLAMNPEIEQWSTSFDFRPKISQAPSRGNHCAVEAELCR